MEALEAHAKQECLSLTTRMSNKLPRKLQDIICSHLSVDSALTWNQKSQPLTPDC
ncbi:hypothetical protein K469DRAFT_721804 [Zopfia rhizophila CBS 207.26]|uniref:Uncharacterized protein n=1 Tax=Zopfia rhizophila CBS 207.26 TaxID=1314779 RepID=A0A6A6EJG1_9PEZI|nr:hypothetical protein K469DRAFT_721804 [Zopfia rhizophila CBS 207.26]